MKVLHVLWILAYVFGVMAIPQQSFAQNAAHFFNAPGGGESAESKEECFHFLVVSVECWVVS